MEIIIHNYSYHPHILEGAGFDKRKTSHLRSLPLRKTSPSRSSPDCQSWRPRTASRRRTTGDCRTGGIVCGCLDRTWRSSQSRLTTQTTDHRHGASLWTERVEYQRVRKTEGWKGGNFLKNCKLVIWEQSSVAVVISRYLLSFIYCTDEL